MEEFSKKYWRKAEKIVKWNSWLQQINFSVFSSLEKCRKLENGVFNEEKSDLEKQYLSSCYWFQFLCHQSCICRWFASPVHGGQWLPRCLGTNGNSPLGKWNSEKCWDSPTASDVHEWFAKGIWNRKCRNSKCKHPCTSWRYGRC